MGNNKEIRQRMETCRKVLLVLVWIGAISGLISGMSMASGYNDILKIIGVVMSIGAILGGVIGHFLVNVVLAIPFILLNNGDILASISGNSGIAVNSSLSNSVDNSSIDWVCKKCGKTNRNTALFCNGCGEKK
jgi:hypothetical protein